MSTAKNYTKQKQKKTQLTWGHTDSLAASEEKQTGQTEARTNKLKLGSESILCMAMDGDLLVSCLGCSKVRRA